MAAEHGGSGADDSAQVWRTRVGDAGAGDPGVRLGTSQLARRCKNYFGIKALPGEAYEEFPTREVVAGRNVRELAHFAKYPSAIESFEAHGRLLATLPRYAKAMEYTGDCVAFCVALRVAGYSTEPDYAFRLTSLIEQFHLEQYDTPQPDGPATAQEAA